MVALASMEGRWRDGLRGKPQRWARLDAQVVALQREGCRQAAVGLVGGEELLDLLHRRLAAEAGEPAHELHECEIAGRQRVGIAAAVKAEALKGPGADLADRAQAAVV